MPRRLDDLHAAVLRVKLKRVDDWSQRRRQIARIYDQGLADALMTLPFTPTGYEHVYHLYVVECDDRDGLQAHLASNGITVLTNYPIAIHQQEGFLWERPARIDGSLSVTEKSAASVLSLPMYPELSDEEAERVVEGIMNWSASQQVLSNAAA